MKATHMLVRTRGRGYNYLLDKNNPGWFKVDAPRKDWVNGIRDNYFTKDWDNYKIIPIKPTSLENK